MNADQPIPYALVDLDAPIAFWPTDPAYSFSLSHHTATAKKFLPEVLNLRNAQPEHVGAKASRGDQ